MSVTWSNTKMLIQSLFQDVHIKGMQECKAISDAVKCSVCGHARGSHIVLCCLEEGCLCGCFVKSKKSEGNFEQVPVEKQMSEESTTLLPRPRPIAVSFTGLLHYDEEQANAYMDQQDRLLANANATILECAKDLNGRRSFFERGK